MGIINYLIGDPPYNCPTRPDCPSRKIKVVTVPPNRLNMETERKVLDRLAGREYRPPLKAYMAYSREGSPEECAVLIFAPTAKEAKKLAWAEAKYELTEEYTDLAIKLDKDKEFLFADADQEKLRPIS